VEIEVSEAMDEQAQTADRRTHLDPATFVSQSVGYLGKAAKEGCKSQ